MAGVYDGFGNITEKWLKALAKYEDIYENYDENAL
jgi:hypothetical protein